MHRHMGRTRRHDSLTPSNSTLKKPRHSLIIIHIQRRQQARQRRIVRAVHEDLQRVLLALLLAARLDLALHLTRHVVEEAPEAETADFFGFVWGEGVRLDWVRGVRRG